MKIENIHFDVRGEFKKSTSEIVKVFCLVRFWTSFLPELRQSIITEKCKNMLSATDGILGATLNALEQINLEKLYEEIERNDRISNKRHQEQKREDHPA